MKKERGFTLIEILVAVAIAAILAMIAYPIYTHYIEKSRRSAAITALQRAATAEEKYYAVHNEYAASLTSLGYTTRTVDVPASGKWYAVSAATSAGGYLLTASPEGVQASDGCGTYQLSSTGAQTVSVPSGSSKTANDCWGGS